MKRFLLLLALFCPTLIQAQNFINGGFFNACGSSILCEGFEGWTNFAQNFSSPYGLAVNNGWKAQWSFGSGSLSSIYQTNNAVLLGMEGTNTLVLIDPAGDFPSMTHILPADQSECWIYIEWRTHFPNFNTQPFYGQLQLLDTGSNNAAKMFMTPSGFMTISNSLGMGTPVGNELATTPSGDTSYSIWFHYLAGSGANGVTSCAFATIGSTRPTSGGQFASLSTGPATGSIRYIRLNGRQDNFDKVRVYSGSTPPPDVP